MAESMGSLFRRGMISKKQMGRMSKPAVLKRTKPGVPAKMAAFDGKGSRDQGQAHGRGAIAGDEINQSAHQKTGRPETASGLPSKGGQARGGTEPMKGLIDQAALQKRKFPAGDTIKGAHGKRKVGVGGGSTPKSAPSQYGGPSSRKYG